MRGMFALAVRNLGRRRGRALALVLGIASLAATAFLISSLFASSHQSITRGGMRLGADAVAVPRGEGGAFASGNALLAGMPSHEYLDASIVNTLAARDDVDASTGQLFIVSAELPCCSVGDTLLVGFDPEGDFTVRPWLRDMLVSPLRSDEIIVGYGLLSEPGGKVTFFGSLFTIAGKLEPTGITSLDRSVFMPLEGARRMIADSSRKAEQTLNIPPDRLSAVFLRFAPGVEAERAAIEIEYEHPELEVVLASRTLTEARQKLTAPLWAMTAAGVLQWAAVLVLAGVLFSLSIGERSREAGLLRAMGARRGHIKAMFLWEAVIVSALGAAVGTALGVFGLFLFKDFLRVMMRGALLMPSGALLAWLSAGAFGFATLAGLLASLRPASRAARRSIQLSITH
jgi:putative ABC transport system permease protein